MMNTQDAVRLNYYCHFIAIIILYYDYLLTLPREIACIWRRPWTQSTFWFFLNRYLTFFGDIAVTFTAFVDADEHTCTKLVYFHQIELIAAQVVVCIVLTIRTYALYEKSKRILALILTIALSLFGISVWGVASQSSATSTFLPGRGCHWGTTRDSATRIAIAWEALFALDTLIFGLTLWRTWAVRRRRGHRRTSSGRRVKLGMGNGKLDILGVVMRDGAMYFGVMALANLANILTFYLLNPVARGVLSTFASAVSVTLLSRLILNLHGPMLGGSSARGSSGDVLTRSVRPSTTMQDDIGIFTSRVDMGPELEIGTEAEVGSETVGRVRWEYELDWVEVERDEEAGESGEQDPYKLGHKPRGSEGDGRFGRQWGRIRR